LKENRKSKGIYRKKDKGSSKKTRKRLEMRREGVILERKDLYSQLNYTSRGNCH